MYKVLTNHHEYLLNEEEIENIEILKEDDRTMIISQGSKTYKVCLLSSEENYKNLTFKINGKIIHTHLKTPYELIAEDMGLTTGHSVATGDIRAPMPGIILEVMVRERDQVEQGSPLLVLEAMKMENVIKAPHSGIIKSIHVKEGESIDKNDLLIILDEHQ